MIPESVLNNKRRNNHILYEKEIKQRIREIINQTTDNIWALYVVRVTKNIYRYQRNMI